MLGSVDNIVSRLIEAKPWLNMSPIGNAIGTVYLWQEVLVKTRINPTWEITTNVEGSSTVELVGVMRAVSAMNIATNMEFTVTVSAVKVGLS